MNKLNLSKIVLILFFVAFFTNCSVENTTQDIEKANISVKLFDAPENYTIQIIPDAKSGYSEMTLNDINVSIRNVTETGNIELI